MHMEHSPHRSPKRYEILIIGGGLAGLSAADRLRDTGLSTIVLEANERLGGRTFGQYWESAGVKIDLGGTWLLPSFSMTYEKLSELGISTRDSPAADLWLTHFSNGVQAERTLRPDEARLICELSDEMERTYEASGRKPTAAEALGSVSMPQRLLDWHIATQRYLVGAPLTEIDAGHLFMDHEDLLNPEHYSAQIVGTTDALVTGMAARSTADIQTDAVVSKVNRINEEWLVSTTDGNEYRARDLICAAPRNTLDEIEFSPAPGGDLRELIEHPHVGQSRKDWMILDNVGEHFRVFASEGPFGYFRSEARLDDGGMLAVALAPQSEGVLDAATIEKAIQAYLPGSRVRDHLHYDWTADPRARGTWLGPLPGDYLRNIAFTTPSESIQFVGGDFSTEHPGTIEGAISTGTIAADRIIGLRKEASGLQQ